MKPKAFFVVSRYRENIDWLDEYTDDYLVYNKGDFIRDDIRIVKTPNEGGNQKDILRFICDNYYNLPDLIAFVQAFPFDHVSKDIFNRLIYNEYFTSLEYYGFVPANGFEGRTTDGEFLEVNTPWYIHSHNATHNQGCRYTSFDEFMLKYFQDYIHIEWLRFCPGSQYIVQKMQILNYSKKFWESLFGELQGLTPTEGHVIERSLWYIFNGNFKVKEEYE